MFKVNGIATDPDGNLKASNGVKSPALASFLIVNPISAVIKIKNLVPGVYVFKLEIMDNGGVISSDNIQITVLAVSNVINRPSLMEEMMYMCLDIRIVS